MINEQDLANLMLTAWHASYSDNGAIWAKANDELVRGRAEANEFVISSAFALARSVWPGEKVD